MKRFLAGFGFALTALLSLGLWAQTTTVSPVVTITCSAGSFLSQLAATGIFTCTAVPAVSLQTGTSATFSGNYGIIVCTGTCTITVPVPAAGKQFCAWNDDNVATVITLSAIGSSAQYENTARTAYGTAGTGTLVSAGAVGDKVCIVGVDSTHYHTISYLGTWTAS